MIDWTDPKCMVSKYFCVKEAIGLPSWGRLASVGDGLTPEIEDRIVKFLENVMDPLREFFGKPINVHCCYRPAAYNKEMGGAPNSAHMFGGDWGAMDFDIGEPCDDTRSKLLDQLEARNIRMEDSPGADWVHVDSAPVVVRRFFIP